MTRVVRPRIALLVGALVLAAGCGQSRRPLAGAVTFDGAPVDGGGIQFVPLDPALPQGKVSGQIVAGKYALDDTRGPFPGKYRVEIMWAKKTGKKVSNGDGGFNEATVEGLPAKYNSNSELTADITSSTSTLDFNLTK